MHYGELETFAVALLAMVDPVGNAVIFIGMTQDRSAAERAAIVRATSAAVAALLLLAAWAGEPLLALLSISVPAFEAAGGLIVLRLGLAMLHGGPEEPRQPGAGAARNESIAIVPLAMPLLVGPGAMATVIVQTHKLPSYADTLGVSAICVAVALLVWVCLRAAAPVCRALGPDGVGVLSRVLGVLLAAIGAGMIATGVNGLFPGLG